MLLSGAIFITGAIGFDFLAGWIVYAEYVDKGDLGLLMTITFEEGLECRACQPYLRLISLQVTRGPFSSKNARADRCLTASWPGGFGL